jgi:hypothetical protein
MLCQGAVSPIGASLEAPLQKIYVGHRRMSQVSIDPVGMHEKDAVIITGYDVRVNFDNSEQELRL